MLVLHKFVFVIVGTTIAMNTVRMPIVVGKVALTGVYIAVAIYVTAVNVLRSMWRHLFTCVREDCARTRALIRDWGFHVVCLFPTVLLLLLLQWE